MLATAREERGMTQAEVARRLGKPQSFVSKYEAGDRRLDFTEFMEIATVLSLDIALFLSSYQERIEQGGYQFQKTPPSLS